MIQYIKTEEELQTLLSNDKLILKVGRENCGPCRILDAMLNKLNANNPNSNIALIEASEDTYPLLQFITDTFLEGNRIAGVPLTILFENGLVKEVIRGFYNSWTADNDNILTLFLKEKV